jgi:hypothetical protein
MRMAFGLVSLLVVVALMCLFFYNIEAPELDAGHQAQMQVQQMAGRDGNGVPVDQTYVVQAESRADGKLKDLLVTHINLGSPMDTFFGLQEKDKIIGAIGQGGYQTDFGGSDDAEGAKLAVKDAYQLQGKLIVMRGDQKVTLPEPGHAAAVLLQQQQQQAAANAANAAPAANNTPAPQQPSNSGDDALKQLQDQIKGTMH